MFHNNRFATSPLPSPVNLLTPANTPRTSVDGRSNSNSNTPNLHQSKISRVNQLSVIIKQQEELQKEMVKVQEMVQSRIEDEASSKPVKLPKELSACDM